MTAQISTKRIEGCSARPISEPISESVRGIFARAKDPRDAGELSRLYLGSIEAELGPASTRPEAADYWRSASRLRDVADEEIRNSRTTVRWVKRLFNHYFRDDLFGALRRDDTIILSSGALDETVYGLPLSLKRAITTALDRDWYGYSDSRGRISSRRAIAALENARIPGEPYDEEWVALTMGGTFSIACLADFLLGGAATTAPAICAIPNYPPLVEAIARRVDVELVDSATDAGWTDISGLIHAARVDTPLILLQTATNPTGTRVPENQIARLIRKASTSTIVILDEAHECLTGDMPPLRCTERANPNVIRVASLSKTHAVPGMKLGWLVAHPDIMHEYYEYASTTYGGPPSLFYLLLEMAARFGEWEANGMAVPSKDAPRAFESTYGFTFAGLAREYAGYRVQRRALEREISEARSRAVDALEAGGCRPTRATHSVNVAFRPRSGTSSYAWFRKCLAATNVSCFPGILTFGLGDDQMRITVGRRPDDLAVGLQEVIAFAGKR